MLQQYLSLPFRNGNIETKSPYIAALVDARGATGRNIATGEIINPDHLGSWCGALSYLVLIDHIGTFISKVVGGDNSDRKFVKALKDFTDLTDPEIYALYALRCAFAHKYSLINEGKANDPNIKAFLHHQFEVHRGETLITLAVPAWNGVRDPATHNRITSVSLKKLGDLVERIHTKLLAMVALDQLVSDKELVFISYQVA